MEHIQYDYYSEDAADEERDGSPDVRSEWLWRINNPMPPESRLHAMLGMLVSHIKGAFTSSEETPRLLREFEHKIFFSKPLTEVLVIEDSRLQELNDTQCNSMLRASINDVNSTKG